MYKFLAVENMEKKRAARWVGEAVIIWPLPLVPRATLQ